VAIHAADADRMRRGVNGPLKPTSFVGRLLIPFFDQPYPGVEPDVVLNEECDVSDLGTAVRVIHTPGHTPGSISVLTPDREIIVGDLLMGGPFTGYLFPHRPTFEFVAEDCDAVRASVRKVLALSPTRVYTGHGGPLDPERIARWIEKV
jgi:glyoxylase-like metal-dependent hydrolase (beta-lactamase superfamily II)